MKNLILGAISLIAKFDMEEDETTIDNLICHAIKSGIDIENISENDEIELAQVI